MDRVWYVRVRTVGNRSTSRDTETKVCDVTSSEVWGAETAARYDAEDQGMFAPEVLGPTVDLLAELAGDGPALEFAIGTGRVGVPLRERGVPVAGIELSEPMAAQLRAKVTEEQLARHDR